MGANGKLIPLLALDRVARLEAASNNSPFDVAILDPGPYITAPKEKIFQPFPVEISENYAKVLPRYQNAGGSEATENWGSVIGLQFAGIAYNPKIITTPPTSWTDLWNPAYKGRVGIANMDSTLGTGWMVEVAKLNGGNVSKPCKSCNQT